MELIDEQSEIMPEESTPFVQSFTDFSEADEPALPEIPSPFAKAEPEVSAEVRELPVVLENKDKISKLWGKNTKVKPEKSAKKVHKFDTPADEVLDKVFTVPNLLSLMRLVFIPIFLILLFDDHNFLAAFVFAFAAATDFLDGYVARSTHQVSKLGQILDPTVDRILMISGAVGLILVGRLPIWIVVLVILRDVILLIGGAYLLKRWQVRVPVVLAGKVCTTLLYIGFAGILINWPLIPGLGLVRAAWLPGFNAAMCSWGIWFIYAGLILGIFTTAYYIINGAVKMGEAKASNQ